MVRPRTMVGTLRGHLNSEGQGRVINDLLELFSEGEGPGVKGTTIFDDLVAESLKNFSVS